MLPLLSWNAYLVLFAENCHGQYSRFTNIFHQKISEMLTNIINADYISHIYFSMYINSSLYIICLSYDCLQIYYR